MASIVVGRHRQAATLAEQTARLASSTGDRRLDVLAQSVTSTNAFVLGDYRRAEECEHAVVARLDAEFLRDRFGMAGFPVAMARGWLAMTLAERGKFDEAIVRGQEALEIATALGDAYSLQVLAPVSRGARCGSMCRQPFISAKPGFLPGGPRNRVSSRIRR